MNSDQFDQLQMRLFMIEQEEKRKRLLARDAVSKTLASLLNKLAASPSHVKTKQPVPKQVFERHQVCVDYPTTLKVLEKEGLSEDDLNVTLICVDHWKTLSGGYFPVTSIRCPITEQFEMRVLEITSIVNDFCDSDTRHLAYLLKDLFKEVGGEDGHTIIFDNSVSKITKTSAGWDDSLVGNYKVSTPEFEIELEEIVGTNETSDIFVIQAVRIKTSNETKVHFFENGDELSLEDAILQGSLQGFMFDQEVIALWK